MERINGAARKVFKRKWHSVTTLLWTRGRDFPLAILGDRLKCPACKSREVSVMFIPPTNSLRLKARA
jgi:hypothetical protein